MTKSNQGYTVQDYLDNYDDERLEVVCGAYHKLFDPATGQFKTQRYFCKDFRNCALCFSRRSADFRSRMFLACARAEEVGKPWPQWQTMPESKVDAFRQKLSRRDLEMWRAPVAGDRVIIFHDYTDDKLGSKILTIYDLAKEQGLDWEQIAMTPLDKRTSGKLGQATPETRAEDEVLIELLSVAVPGCLTKTQVENCEMQALQKTAHLDPDVDEAIEASHQVIKVLQEELEAAATGYYISQGDDPATAQLNAFRDTPLSIVKRYWSPSSFEPWSNRIASTSKTIGDNRSQYSTRAVPGVDFTPAPVELML